MLETTPLTTLPIEYNQVPLSIDPEFPQEPVEQSIETGIRTVVPKAEVVAQRSSLANYALSGLVPRSFEDYSEFIGRGQEQQIRQEVAATLDEKKQIAVRAEVDRIVSMKEGKLGLEDLQRIQSVMDSPKASDPESVFEDAFSVRYLNSIYALNDRNPVIPQFSFLEDMLRLAPKQLQDHSDIATDAVSKYRFSKRMEEDARAVVEQQGWPSYLGDMALNNLLMIYPSLKQRGSVTGTGILEGGLLGSNLEAQQQALFAMPYDQFKAEYKRIMDKLKEDNPQLALSFARAMTGQSLNEKVLNNLFDVASPFEAYAIGKLAKGITKSAVAMDKSYEMSQAVFKNLSKNADFFEQQPPKVAEAAAVGDLKEAAIQKTAITELKSFQNLNDFDKQAVESLMDFQRVDRIQARENPGRFGQSMSNLMDEMGTSQGYHIAQAIMNFQRVNRTPLPLTVENTVRAMQDYIAQQIKGQDNSLLNISEPVHSQIANGYFFDFKVGTVDMQYFKDFDVAKNYAELKGWVLKPTINQEIGRLSNAMNKAKGEERRALFKQFRDLVKQYPDPEMRKTTFKPMSEGFDIKNDGAGLGWYINIRKFIPETHDIWRNGLVPAEDDAIKNYRDYRKAYAAGKAPTELPPTFLDGFINSSIGWLRTPDEVLSAAESTQRKVATHSQAVLLKHAEAIGEPLAKLPTKYHKDFVRVLKAAQKKADPANNNIAGYTFKSPHDLEGFYLANIKRLPEKEEVAAYFSWKGLVDFDFTLRRMNIFRNEMRNGVELHQFSLPTTRAGENQISGFVKGIRQVEFPVGSETIMVLGKKPGQEKFYHADEIPTKIRQKMEEAHKKGEKQFIRIWNPEEFPLKGWSKLTSDKYIRWVMADSFETKPLSWDNLPRRGGGHLIPDYSHYIKQSIVHKEVLGAGTPNLKITHRYLGDKTIMPIALGKLGEDVAKHMNEVRLLIKAGDEAGAMAYNNRHLPINWDEHRGWYEPSRGPGGEKIEPHLDKDQEIRVVPADKQIAHMDDALVKKYTYIDPITKKEVTTFKDGTRQGSDARLNQVEFTGPRDQFELYTINKKGSRSNPLYSYEPGEYLDPIVATDRSLARIIHSTAMDDMKMMSVEHWLQIAGKYLDAMPNDLKSAPFYWFHNPKWKDGTSIMDKSILLSARKKALDFIGTPSVVDRWTQAMSQKMADSIYGTTGSQRLAVIPLHLIPDATKPVDAVRSFAFHLKQGLFSIKTVFTQMATFTNIWAISPRHAPSATAAALLYSISTLNRSERMMNYLDTLATQIGRGNPGFILEKYRPGWFKEAVESLDKTGFQHVGVEHAYRDTPVSMDLMSNRVKGLWHGVRDWGAMPFQIGSTSTRLGAYFTSHLEWRAANPTAALTREAQHFILERASLLDHNMSRASNSIAHTGLASIPSQFGAYTLRLMDMMLGKRLTPAEKARLFASSSLLYGIPAGGVGLYGLPLVDQMRRYMTTEHNYVVGDNIVASTAMEGGLATAAAIISGGGDQRAGWWHNWAKFGPQGFEPLNTMLSSDKTFLDAVGGVSYGVLKSIGTSTGGMYLVWKQILAPNEPGNPHTFRPTLSNVLDIAREIAAIDAGAKWYTAAMLGEWRNRNDDIIDVDIGNFNAAFMALTGLQPTQAVDMYELRKYMTENKKNEDRVAQIFIREWRRGLDSDDAGNNAQARKYWENALAALDLYKYPEDKRSELLSRANAGREGQVNAVDWKFYIEDAAGRPEKVQGREEAFKKIQEMRQLRGQR